MTTTAQKKQRRPQSNIKPVAKFNNVKGNFQCRWSDCTDTVSDICAYYTHLKRHLWTGQDTSNKNSEICKWRDCESNQPWTATHVYYHGYHEKLKHNGDLKLKARSRDGLQCGYPTERKHTVDVFDVFDCEWIGCDYVLDGPDEFNFHLLIHVNDLIENTNHQTETYKCRWQQCGQEFSYTCLRQHVKSHCSQKDSACSHCGSIFRSTNKFLDHFRRQKLTTGENLECRYCNKKFANERLLRDHERAHVSHYKCPLCDMTMPAPNDVKNHIAARHTSGRPYACIQCPSRFKLPRNLNTHIERVHNTKDLVCSDCDFVTRSHYKMRKHRLTKHDGSSRVYACHLCPATFDIEGHLLSRHLVSVHELQWPSGHRRFHYVRDRDGVFRLQTFRYESAELVELVPDGVDIEKVVVEDDDEYDEEMDETDEVASTTTTSIISEATDL